MCSFPKKEALLLSLFFILWQEPVFAQPRIDLTEGSLFIDGGMSARYGLVVDEPLKHSFKLKTDLSGGYFIIDGLAIGLGIQSNWVVGKNDSATLGLRTFFTYFFDIHSVIFPYLGASVMPNWKMQSKEFQLFAGIDSGILMSLSESVALDFGIRPEVLFKLYDTQRWQFTFPAGFFGVRAVF